MNPTTEIHLAEGAYLEMETVQIKGIDSTVRVTNAEVAEGAGYFDTSHFSRVFKKLEGISAGERRSLH